MLLSTTPFGCCIFFLFLFFFKESVGLPSTTPFGCCILFFPLPGDCSIDHGDMDDVRNPTIIGYKLKNIISSNVYSLPPEIIGDQKTESLVYPQIIHGSALFINVTAEKLKFSDVNHYSCNMRFMTVDFVNAYFVVIFTTKENSKGNPHKQNRKKRQEI
jgi:hypothetical protein